MDETLFFDFLSARFKPWYHSWPYVSESATINPCLKIVIFYRTSPELPTFLVVSNLKGRWMQQLLEGKGSAYYAAIGYIIVIIRVIQA